jgi:uncharacterized membrane protein YkgB
VGRITSFIIITTLSFVLTEPEVIELDDDDIDGVTSRPANNNKPTNTFVVVQGPHGPILVNI